jgi:F420-0:gamma-glutamyl ligase
MRNGSANGGLHTDDDGIELEQQHGATAAAAGVADESDFDWEEQERGPHHRRASSAESAAELSASRGDWL